MCSSDLDHDLSFKMRAARRFVEAGNKVKFVVRFRGREIAHPQQAEMQLKWLLEQLEDLVNVESRPMMEGRTMTVMVNPKPQVLQKVAAAKAALEAARKKAETEGRSGATDAVTAEAARLEQEQKDLEAQLEAQDEADEDEDDDGDEDAS